MDRHLGHAFRLTQVIEGGGASEPARADALAEPAGGLPCIRPARVDHPNPRSKNSGGCA